MNEKSSSREIATTRGDGELARPPQTRERPRLLHPLSAAVVLALDWLAFSSSWASALAAWPLAVGLCALLAFVVTAWAQRREGDAGLRLWAKALGAAALVAVPLPIAGSAVGGWVLAASGLDWLQGYRRRLSG